jgi:hypothetical protein
MQLYRTSPNFQAPKRAVSRHQDNACDVILDLRKQILDKQRQSRRTSAAPLRARIDQLAKQLDAVCA